ncbi:uncharacterized protein LOC108673067 [Hyalella azteca]|uniref:Uncharacterized protein LOC108673067 n=1 Tax=Hyalella azteca TaxID=294128 RepID=A0A8B7NRG4_HYAAZ|nr:uncharacterized protein LOC108673067 [Hyalella azteca]
MIIFHSELLNESIHKVQTMLQMFFVAVVLSVHLSVAADAVGKVAPQGEAFSSGGENADEKIADTDEKARVKPRSPDESDPENMERSAKQFAFYTSSTQAIIATSTVYMLSTCFSTTNETSCSGRRKRNVFSDKMNPFFINDEGNMLSSSLNDPDFEVNSDASKRQLFTIWSTLFSTYTVVTTSYYSGTTVTVSALCNPGFAASCFG